MTMQESKCREQKAFTLNKIQTAKFNSPYYLLKRNGVLGYDKNDFYQSSGERFNGIDEVLSGVGV